MKNYVLLYICGTWVRQDENGWTIHEEDQSIPHNESFSLEMIIDNPIIKPRCPFCGKVIAEWVKGEAGFTCRKCHCRGTISSSAQICTLTSSPFCDSVPLVTR